MRVCSDSFVCEVYVPTALCVKYMFRQVLVGFASRHSDKFMVLVRLFNNAVSTA